MFGIGLPELILIMGIALIVVGPEKLPEMAKSMARLALDLKKSVAELKDNLQEERREEPGPDEPWRETEPAAARSLPAPDAVSGQESAEAETEAEPASEVRGEAAGKESQAG